MFKLAITALLATTNASAAKDKAAVEKDAATAKAGAEKYHVTPGAPIWVKGKFMDETTATPYTFSTTSKTIED